MQIHSNMLFKHSTEHVFFVNKLLTAWVNGLQSGWDQVSTLESTQRRKIIKILYWNPRIELWAVENTKQNERLDNLRMELEAKIDQLIIKTTKKEEKDITSYLHHAKNSITMKLVGSDLNWYSKSYSKIFKKPSSCVKLKNLYSIQ